MGWKDPPSCLSYLFHVCFSSTSAQVPEYVQQVPSRTASASGCMFLTCRAQNTPTNVLSTVYMCDVHSMRSGSSWWSRHRGPVCCPLRATCNSQGALCSCIAGADQDLPWQGRTSQLAQTLLVRLLQRTQADSAIDVRLGTDVTTQQTSK